MNKDFLRQVLKGEKKLMKSFLVINMKVKDNPTEASKASPFALQLCKKIEESAEDWEDDIEEIIEDFSNGTGKKPFYTICFY